MSNLKTELRELLKIIKFFATVLGLMAFAWLFIFAMWAGFGK